MRLLSPTSLYVISEDPCEPLFSNADEDETDMPSLTNRIRQLPRGAKELPELVKRQRSMFVSLRLLGKH